MTPNRMMDMWRVLPLGIDDTWWRRGQLELEEGADCRHPFSSGLVPLHNHRSWRWYQNIALNFAQKILIHCLTHYKILEIRKTKVTEANVYKKWKIMHSEWQWETILDLTWRQEKYSFLVGGISYKDLWWSLRCCDNKHCSILIFKKMYVLHNLLSH